MEGSVRRITFENRQLLQLRRISRNFVERLTENMYLKWNVAWFSVQLLSQTFLHPGIIQRRIVNVLRSSCKLPIFFSCFKQN